jgi:3-hydroxyisobutyrate dehydrogenase-like beta-hydroxyacid dehydrogenase
MPPTIAIIGSGNVGKTLCSQLLKKGRHVVVGSRNPAAAQQELASKGVAAVSVAEAVSQADVVLLAIPGTFLNLIKCLTATDSSCRALTSAAAAVASTLRSARVAGCRRCSGCGRKPGAWYC